MNAPLQLGPLEDLEAAARQEEALEAFRRFLARRGLRMTGPREATLKAVMSQEGHFTPEDIARRTVQLGKPIPLVTIYRLLPLLVEGRVLQPVQLSGEGRCYEIAFGREQHDHLTCARCRRVIEFRCRAFRPLGREVARQYGFELSAQFHELVGVCETCRSSSPRLVGVPSPQIQQRDDKK